MKTCTFCKQEKEERQFYVHTTNKRRMGKCMECVRTFARARYAIKRVSILEKSQAIRDTRKAMRTMELA